MSRFETDDYSDGPTITWEMWQHNLKLALSGKRGQHALRELREALLALPEKRLISRALCTVGVTAEADRLREHEGNHWRINNIMEYVNHNNGEGVCAVGAYAWFRKVKAGMDPQEAFASLPRLYDDDYSGYETAQLGKDAGMTVTLAWHLGSLNDEEWSGLTPEDRYTACLRWINEHIASPTQEVKP